jgi:hypothetical protein
MTAGLVTPLSFTVARATGLTGWIRRVGVKVNDTAWLNATVRVHFYENSPTSAAGDLAAWSSTESGYKGYVDVILSEQFSDPCVKGFGAPSVGSDIGFVAGGGSQVIYAILSSQSAVASPAAGKTFTVTLETVQN